MCSRQILKAGKSARSPARSSIDVGVWVAAPVMLVTAAAPVLSLVWLPGVLQSWMASRTRLAGTAELLYRVEGRLGTSWVRVGDVLAFWRPPLNETLRRALLR